MYRRITFVLIAMSVCLTLTACGGGGAVVPSGPPVITAVTPSGPAGAAGTVVQFSAVVSQSPTSWEWDFNRGAFPLTSTAASPEVTLLTTGTYNGTVRAANDFGASATFSFTYTVSPGEPRPKILEVSPMGTVGGRGDQVQFSAIATGAPTSWQWEFVGGGSPGSSTDASPLIDLPLGGRFNGQVIAGNAAGDSEPFPFEFRVDHRPDWSHQQPEPYPAYGSVSLVEYRGRLAAVYRSYIGEVRFLRAKVAHPSQAADWEVSLIAGRGAVTNVTLAVVADRLIAAFVRAEFPPKPVTIAVATVDEPRGESDWALHDFPQEDLGLHFSFVEFEGRAALAFTEQADNLHLALASTTAPMSAADWSITPIDMDPGNHPSLVVHAGKLAVAYESELAADLQVALALTEHPGGPADWAIHKPDTTPFGGHGPEMVSLNGRLVISHKTPQLPVLSRALSAVPASSADWARTTIETFRIRDSDLAVVDDRLVVAYSRESDLAVFVARAWIPSPAGPADWERSDLHQTHESSGISVIGHDGRIVVGFPGFWPPDGVALSILETEEPW